MHGPARSQRSEESSSGLGPIPRGQDLAEAARHVVERDYTSSECQTAKLARALDVSESHLCNVYQQRWGTTIGSDVRALRIALACELLETTDLLCKDIAARCGYLHASYRAFLNAFGAETGATPREYRRAHG